MKQIKIEQFERERIFTIQEDGSLMEESCPSLRKLKFEGVASRGRSADPQIAECWGQNFVSKFWKNFSNDFFGEKMLTSDIDAISVFDYLHTDENDEFYRKDNSEFGDVVSNVLTKQTFNIAIKRVLTANDNTSLRIKNINQELSPTFKDFSNDRPVVLGHGLFGNLFSMGDLGMKIATDDFDGEDYRDTWLIEYTGGPNTECEGCSYDMDDLVDYYWPTLIGGVLAYTGESEVDYVGYSAGGGVGARSYEKYYEGDANMGYYVNEDGEWESFDLPEDFVDHMALIAPMGAFNGTTVFTECIDAYGEEVLEDLSKYSHINREIIVKELGVVAAKNSLLEISFPSNDNKESCMMAFSALLLPSGENISYNYWEDITELVINKTDENPNLNVNELLLIYGAFGGYGDDGVIPDDDIQNIYDNAYVSEKYKGRVFDFHASMEAMPGTYNPLLTKFLNDISYSQWDKFWRNIEYYITI